MAEAAHLHGLLAVEVGQAGLVVDVQVLRGVVVAHMDRDVVVDAPHLVHQGLKALDINGDIVVQGDAQQIGDHPAHLLRSVVIGGVDLGVLLGHGVPGDGDQAGGLVGGIIHGHSDGVGISAGLVGTDQQHGVALLFPRQAGLLLPAAGERLGAGLNRIRHLDLLRGLGSQAVGAKAHHHHGGQGHQQAVKYSSRPAQG